MNLRKKIIKKLHWIRNPYVSLSLFIIANMISFIDVLQKPFYGVVGSAGNMFLTFSFAFFLILSGLGFNRIFKKKFFIYVSYCGILIYFVLYFKWVLTIHYIYTVGIFIMVLGIYSALTLDKEYK